MFFATCNLLINVMEGVLDSVGLHIIMGAGERSWLAAAAVWLCEQFGGKIEIPRAHIRDYARFALLLLDTILDS